MEKLLQQVRDNLRLSNWALFPGNSIKYIYDNTISMNPIEVVYLRNGGIQFSVEKIYDEITEALIEEKYKSHTDGTDNL